MKWDVEDWTDSAYDPLADLLNYQFFKGSPGSFLKHSAMRNKGEWRWSFIIHNMALDGGDKFSLCSSHSLPGKGALSIHSAEPVWIQHIESPLILHGKGSPAMKHIPSLTEQLLLRTASWNCLFTLLFRKSNTVKHWFSIHTFGGIPYGLWTLLWSHPNSSVIDLFPFIYCILDFQCILHSI
jgi:hypothetical protein